MRSIPFGKPILGDAERQAVFEVMDSGIMAHGPRIGAFEAAFAELTAAPHAVGVASCTAGLHLLYFHLGLGPGDEVVVPAMTHTATAHAVELTGARAVFVDAERRTGNLDLDALEDAIGERTRAVSVVHYLGMPVDMVRVCEIARRHGLPVIEDAALAVGTRLDGVHAGLHGDAGVFSFSPVKHMTTAEGGMVITRHADLAASLTRKRAFGMDRHVGQRKVPGLYDVLGLGLNYRMNEIQAAIGVEQVKRMPGFLEARKRNHEALTKELSQIDEVTLLASSEGRFQSSYYCHAMVLDESLAKRRPELMAALKERGVGTSIYYPHPVPLMTYYREKYGHADGDFPAAQWISDQSVALPVGPHAGPDDMVYIGTAVKEAIMEVR